MLERTQQLLSFLKDVSALRQRRFAEYGPNDRVLYFGDLPLDLPEPWRNALRSPFFQQNATAPTAEVWLEIRKRSKPVLKQVPAELEAWLPQAFQDNPEEFLNKDTVELFNLLKREIFIQTTMQVPDPDAPPGEHRMVTAQVNQLLRLQDYPGIQQGWQEYLERCWSPWSEAMRHWQRVQQVYEDVDFMRRRVEESEERYELFLALGLLQWQDSQGRTVKRHLIVGAAEIELDPDRGILTVGPAASFESFRLELDMLEGQDRPVLPTADIEGRLAELDIQAWKTDSIEPILRIIANRARANSQVHIDALKPLERTDRTFRVLYAPALVLRERRVTIYTTFVEKLCRAIQEQGEQGFQPTAPWRRLISEGNEADPPADSHDGLDSAGPDQDNRIYFPLPTNDEQRDILYRLRKRPYVLVKGPPGTGKSHTIANLICHLLTRGERILITAQAPKALEVLRDLLPEEIRSLCVTALGGGRDEQELLKKSVQAILARHDRWRENTVPEGIERLDQELQRLEDELTVIDRQLRECREAETYTHTLPGGYSGTAAQIAYQIEEATHRYDWFPELPSDEIACPLQPDESAALADLHAAWTTERLDELRKDIGGFDLPEPERFAQAIRALASAESAAAQAAAGLPESTLQRLEVWPESVLDTLLLLLQRLEEAATRGEHVLGDLAGELLRDMLLGRDAVWQRRAADLRQLAERVHLQRERVQNVAVEVPSDVNAARWLADAQRRLEHFKRGGWRGLGFLAPRVVRETRYLEEQSRVLGQAPRTVEALEQLAVYLQLTTLIQAFTQRWPRPSSLSSHNPHTAAEQVAELMGELERVLGLFNDTSRQALEVVPVEERSALARRGGRQEWRRRVEAALAARRAQREREQIAQWRNLLDTVDGASTHAVIEDLRSAIDQRDISGWRTSWTKREHLRAERARREQYEELVTRIREACPEVADLLETTEGKPEWTERWRQLGQAWSWASARAWIRKVSAPETLPRLTTKHRALQEERAKKLRELAALKSWWMAFNRFSDHTLANLQAWRQAIHRIGQGTGVYAPRHRQSARRYLKECLPAIPAWIMPLHKLWETTEPSAAVFDTVIVDEASQAGVDALVLFLLAKRIIIVGDDKQNSPEAVGIDEEAIQRLQHQHLGTFHFRREYRLDSSLYDHALRVFGNAVSLREHFRCVPEIIRFSNDLCYQDAPLIPLRQPPPRRLLPLRPYFVPTGSCIGDGQRIQNHAEADVLVKQICECLKDPAYNGKTVGVIALQGRAQAELIERKLSEKIEPSVRHAVKLRCGVPATFQGDERDVIFLSLVIAPNHNFRALTTLDDQRRFNVAMSRARDQVWLFHSVRDSDLSPNDLRRQLLRHFYATDPSLETVHADLEHLEREARRMPREPGSQPPPYESWFEVDVALELLRRRYRICPQVEVAGYRIDLVVEGDHNRLAVECDGDSWHGAEAFERDMARQRQLERAGWEFVRIRASEFYADRERVIERVTTACQARGILPAGERQSNGNPATVEQDNHATAAVAPARDTELETLPESSEDGRADRETGQAAFAPTERRLSAADSVRPASPAQPSRDPEQERSFDLFPHIVDSESVAGGTSMQLALPDPRTAPLTVPREARTRTPPQLPFPDPRVASFDEVRQALYRLIFEAGPLNKRLLFRLYLDRCPSLNHIDRKIKSWLNVVLHSMQIGREIIIDDELRDQSLESKVIRLETQTVNLKRLHYYRDLLEIHPSELFLWLDRLPRNITPDNLYYHLRDYYGFERLTPRGKAYLGRVIALYRRQRRTP